MLGVAFGLNADEWNFLAIFFAALLTALVPLYWSNIRGRRDVREVKKEVTTNGGMWNGHEPTVKDYAKGAYDEAVLASRIADRAVLAAVRLGERLDMHLEEASVHVASIDERLVRLDALTTVLAEINQILHELPPTPEDP